MKIQRQRLSIGILLIVIFALACSFLGTETNSVDIDATVNARVEATQRASESAMAQPEMTMNVSPTQIVSLENLDNMQTLIGIWGFWELELNKEIPSGWKSYYAPLWVQAVNNNIIDTFNLEIDQMADVSNLSPYEDNNSPYVETQEGVNYPVDIVVPAGTPSGVRYDSIRTLNYGFPTPVGVPITGHWAGQFFPISQFGAWFLVPEQLHPARLVFPNMQTTIDLPPLNTETSLPNVSSELSEELPATFQLNEYLSVTLSQLKAQWYENQVLIYSELTITNTDVTAQQKFERLSASLIDSEGLFWKQESDNCEIPSSVGPGQTVSGRICFAVPYLDVFDTMSEYYVLTVVGESIRINYLNKSGDALSLPVAVIEAQMARGPDGNEPTTVFAQDDTFYAVVNVTNDTKVKAVWIAVEADGVDPNFELGQKELEGHGTLTFSLSNEEGWLWPVGEYKVDLYQYGELSRTLEFRVEAN